jgi:translation initiation factor 1A
MPLKKGKGGNKRRKAKSTVTETKKNFIYKDAESEYACVTKVLGGLRFEVQVNDGTTRMAKLRGRLKRRGWIGKDDYVLVSLRDFQDDKCDIIHFYKESYEKNIVKKFFGPSHMNKNDDDDGDADVDFTYVERVAEGKEKQDEYFAFSSSYSYEGSAEAEDDIENI